MRSTILATLATTTLLLPEMFGGAAQAMTAAPSVTTGLVEKAAVTVAGGSGRVITAITHIGITDGIAGTGNSGRKS
jgi:hypothetical protein